MIFSCDTSQKKNELRHGLYYAQINIKLFFFLDKCSLYSNYILIFIFFGINLNMKEQPYSDKIILKFIVIG